MKFGVKLPNSGPFANPECLHALAVECENLSYDSIWLTDHIHWTVAQAKYHFPSGAVEAWQDPIEPNYYEPLVTLSYFAGITSKLTLGSSIVVLPTHNPVLLAKQVACMDRLSGGRVVLGVGLGGKAYAKAELGAVGLTHLLGKRGRVADEWIDVIKGIWAGPKFSFEGEFIEVEEAEIFPKPVQRPGPPIWVGGWGEAAIKRAAQRGDGLFQSHLLPEGVRERREQLDRWTMQAGRDPGAVQIASEHWLSIAKDSSVARSMALETMKGMESHPFSDQQRESEKQGVMEGYHLIGTPEMIVQRLASYAASGVDHTLIRVIGRDLSEMVDSLRMFKEEVTVHVGK